MKKCQDCGVPISPRRLVCIDCYHKRHRKATINHIERWRHTKKGEAKRKLWGKVAHTNYYQRNKVKCMIMSMKWMIKKFPKQAEEFIQQLKKEV